MFLAVAFAGLTSAYAQLTRLDSVLAVTVRSHLQTIDQNLRLTTDTTLGALAEAMHFGSGGVTFRLDQAVGVVRDTSSMTRMHVSVMGSELRASGATPKSWSADLDLELTQADKRVLETNASRYVHLAQPPEQPHSFWESTLEPGLVVLGSGLIVALFFLIRS